jgi:type IV secretory pathway VirB2 component (pilin)
MKRTMKLISILLLAVILVSSMSTLCFAEEKKAAAEPVKPSEITPKYDDLDTTDFKGTAQKIMGLIRNIAVIAGVLLIAILGIKYMLGSVEEKADYKKSFVPLIVGAVVVMAATQIATMIFSLAS